MKPVIIALDFKNQAVVFDFLKHFPSPKDLYVKIGMELFDQEGPNIVRRLHRMGIRVFLDLKLYDIPSIVYKTAIQIAHLGVQMTTIHASGGSKMIHLAKQGLIQGAKDINAQPAKLLAVTQLTSTSEEQMQTEQLVNASMKEAVTHLAKLAATNGADGTISSALEDKMIHQVAGKDFLCINPGIRLQNNDNDDQKRVTTPHLAHQLGSDGIVVGRAITKAADPYKAYQIVKQDWEGNN